MSYTDAEMMMATQVAYLNFEGDGRDSNTSVGDVVERTLTMYGTYDSSTGTYTMREGVSGAAEAQFKTAQNIMTLSEQNNVVSWRHWTVVDSCNKQSTSGYYGCLIDTGDGNAIVGCRGSESYDADQAIKDWGYADIGRLNNELTDQQADATAYMKHLYEKYGDSYDSYNFTGHSLGGSLATHSAITAPEGMQDKIDKVVSYDGPGFSDEYLKAHADQIDRVKDKMNHYEYSWVGNLLNQPDGINNRVIKAHDDPGYDDVLKPQLFRHDTKNVEFDENGNVMAGERGALQTTIGPVSRLLENSPQWYQRMFASQFIGLAVLSFAFSISDQIKQDLDAAVQEVKEKANEIYHSFLSLMVSGDYEIHTGEVCRMADELESVQRKLKRIADRVDEIRRTLPYDSASAYFFKHCLWLASNAIVLEGFKAGKISNAADKAVAKYNKGDRGVSELF